jgi:di/tricarboxylate transporter
MKPPRRTFIILLVVVGMVLAFLAGTATATVNAPAAVDALTDAQLAVLQASNVLLLDQGPGYVYLPLVLRNH